MPISFHPKPGTVLICDFSTGFQPPEMVKRRPVVVVSPRYRRRTGLCLVVPFSTAVPQPPEAFHHRIAAGRYPFLSAAKSSWAKCDMLTCVAFHRLDRLLLQGKHIAPSLEPEDFSAIRRGVLRALGFPAS